MAFSTPPCPGNEKDRLRALRARGLLDTAAEERFDRLTRLARRMFGVSIALVSLVDEDRQWFKSRQGLEVAETGRDVSFCGHTILGGDIFEIPDARADARFADNPLVTGEPHIRFYAGAPLSASDGYRIGTLCLIDSQPRQLSEDERRSLRDLADAVQAEIDSTEQRALGNALTDLRQLGEVITRAQSAFIRDADQDRGQVFDGLLADTLELTLSEYGFIGEVLHTPEGSPYLKTSAITNIAWDDATRAFYAANAPQGLEFHNLETLFGAALTGAGPVIANDPAGDPRSGGLPEGHPPLKAFLGIPIEHGGERIAVLGIANRPGGYDPGMVEFLQPLLATLGQLVDAARTRRRYRAGQLERARLSRVASETTNGVIITDADGRVEWINDGFTRLSGYTLDAMLGRQPGELLQGAGTDPETVARIGEALARGEPFVEELLNYRIDGHPYWVRIQCTPLRDEQGMLQGFIAIESDVTREREDAERIRESEQQFRSLVDNIPGITYRCLPDADWTMLYMSDQVDPLSGYPASDFIDNSVRSYASVIHEDDQARVQDAVEQALSAGNDWSVEYRIWHRDGSIRWAQERGSAIRDPDGRVRYLDGFILDATREREHREQHQRQLDAFAALNEIASLVALDLDDQLERALQMGADFLGLELGIVSRIRGDDYTVRAFVAPAGAPLERGQRFALGRTYCALTLAHNDLLTIEHMAASEHQGHPCYADFGLEAYIGVVLEVEGQRFGTLNFSSAHPRPAAFSEGERMFVRLLGRWVAASLEREQSHEQLKKLTSLVPGMVYQYRQWPDGRVAFPYSSPGIRDIYGISAEAAREDASAVFRSLHPKDRDRVAQSIERSRRELSNWHCEYRTLRDDGRVGWVQGHASPEPLDDGSTLWHGYIRDITDEKEAELAVADSEARLRGLFELSPVGIALNDYETGAFVDLNAALLRPTGYTREEFVALSYWDVTPREYAAQEAQQLESMEQTGRYGPYEKEYIRKDGTRYPVLLNGMVVHDKSGRKLIWSIIEDISERKRIERMKNEFISTVSHELRTPLTSISGALGLLTGGAAGALPERMQEMLEIAHKNSQRLGLLINDLLDMEKLVAGKMRFEMQEQPLFPLLEQAVRSNQSYADQYEVHLMLDAEDDGVRVEVDADRLQQVLANLLSNAAKFSPEGGEVRMTMEHGEARVRVSVIDHGPGIPEAFRERIFQKFSQADASDTRQKGGSGLGLAITRELVERMGGEVGFDSVPDAGATFWFELGCHREEARG